MSETGICDRCGRESELAEGMIICVECTGDDHTCPSCGYEARHLAILKCVTCGKVVCDHCHTMTIGGLTACSEECDSEYCKTRLETFERTHVW